MLSLSSEYQRLLSWSGHALGESHPVLLPPVPLRPFAFCVVGRLSSLSALRHGQALLAAIRQVSVKTALKKATHKPHPQGEGQTPLSEAELASVVAAAENPSWLAELLAHVASHSHSQSEDACRYLMMEDILHPNSVSRFHFLVKRERVAQQQQQGSAEQAAAASAAAASVMHLPTCPVCCQPYDSADPDAATRPRHAPRNLACGHAFCAACITDMTAQATENLVRCPECRCPTLVGSVHDLPLNLGLIQMLQRPQQAPAQLQEASSAAADASSQSQTAARPKYCYFVKDLGSLNGLYIDNVRVRHSLWTPMREGTRLRFAPQTRNAKQYIAAFQMADVATEQARRAAVANGQAAESVAPVAPVMPPVPLSIKDMHIELVFSHAMDDACLRRISQLDVPLPVSSTSALTKEQDAARQRRGAAAASRALPAAAAAAAASSVVSVAPTRPAAAADLRPNAAFLAQQQAMEASKAAFYARFTSKSPAAATDSASAVPLDLEELNAAPVPSNFEERAAAAAAQAAMPARGRKRERAVVDGLSGGSAAASSLSGDGAAAPKRARAARGRVPGTLSAYMMFARAHRPSVRAELAAARGVSGNSASLFGDTTREVALRWRGLPLPEKAKFQELAAAYNQQAGAAAAAGAAHTEPDADYPMDAMEVEEEEEEDEEYVPPQRMMGAPRAVAAATAASSPSAPASVPAASAASAASAAPAAPAAAPAAPARVREIVELSDDDMPILVRSPQKRALPPAPAPAPLVTKSPPVAAAAAAAAAPAPAAAAAAHAASAAAADSTEVAINPVFASMMEEYTCGICADLIYQCAALDCSHSYCLSCISEWFKKKKLCPVCREKHKGVPTLVRAADNSISLLVSQCLTAEQKLERQQRIARVDAAQREAEQKKADKEAAKAFMQKHGAAQPQMPPPAAAAHWSP